MNHEQLLSVAVEGPTNLQQRAVLLTMAILAKDDGTLSIDARPLLSLIDIPVRNMTYTINELVKKGWLELLTDGSYRIDPTVVVSREALLKGDTNNWG